MRFNVFPGIGDISWVYSKMVDLVDAGVPLGYSILDAAPRRSADFLDLLPGVENLGYGKPFPLWDRGLTYDVPPPLPYWCDLAGLNPGGEYTAGVNAYLEAGMRLEYVWPKQRTHHHYKLRTARYERQAAELVAACQGRPLIGYYASSYAHRPEMGFWSAGQWADFLARVVSLFPGATLLALGASYDDKTRDVHAFCKHAGLDCVEATGQTHIGATVEVLRRLDYFFAFPSGLGILADVVDTPCTMWYWKGRTDEFVDTYADPKNVANLRHVNRLYETVDEAFAAFQIGGSRWLTE